MVRTQYQCDEAQRLGHGILNPYTPDEILQGDFQGTVVHAWWVSVTRLNDAPSHNRQGGPDLLELPGSFINLRMRAELVLCMKKILSLHLKREQILSQKKVGYPSQLFLLMISTSWQLIIAATDDSPFS